MGIASIYCDGGVVGRNPSKVGGTWAFCRVNEANERVVESWGVVKPEFGIGGEVTNNHTELIAIVRALESFPEWSGTLYSDSWVSLQRVFLGAKLRNVPAWLVDHLRHVQRDGLNERVKYVLLDGHPTKAQLAAGIGKRGHPVSEHNVWCDEKCQELAKEMMAAHLHNCEVSSEGVGVG